MYETKRMVSEGAEKLLDLYFPVLDHGFVALKDYCGSDAAVARAARCSYGAGTRAVSDDRNLIRYLVRHKHTSPLEQVEVTLHCVSGDTRISTNLGILKIEDAENAAYAHNTIGVSECGVVKSGRKQLFKINLDRGYSLKLTADHKVLVLDETASLVWKQVKDLAEDDFFVLPENDSFFCTADHYFENNQYDKKTHKLRNVRLPTKLTRELSELIGYYMGDGSSYDNTLEFQVSEKYPNIINRVSWLIENIFDVVPCKNTSHGMVKIRFNSVEVVEWWNSNGFTKKDARDAFIPDCFWTSKKEMAFAFFSGLFGADGSVSVTNGVNLTTSSQKLAEQTQILMSYLGIPMSKIYRPDNYILYTFTNKGLQRYRESIGFTCNLKQEKLDNLDLVFSRTEAIPHAKAIIEKYGLDKDSLRGQYYNGHNLPRMNCPDELDGKIYLSIVNIEPLGEEDVWDISVPKTEMFQANGLIVHNCKMPIFVARQWVRHRTANLNEMSGRYSLMPLQFYSPKFEDFKFQSTDNKQGRGEAIPENLYLENRARSDRAREFVKQNYETDLANDVARELARIDLPLSTYTEWYWKMDLKNLMHFLSLRCDSHAQYEIRAYADIIAGIVKEVIPITYEAWLDYMYTSVEFSYQEMRALIDMGQELGGSGYDGGGFETCIPPEENWGEWGKQYGLSKREVQEFFGKLTLKNRPDYTLDLSIAKSPDYFRREAEKYLPEIG